jgi:hypothetical protein
VTSILAGGLRPSGVDWWTAVREWNEEEEDEGERADGRILATRTGALVGSGAVSINGLC